MNLGVVLQTEIRARLTGDLNLAWLLSPEASRFVLRPDGFPVDPRLTERVVDDGALDLLPRIVLGECQIMPADDLGTYHDEAALTLHVWTKGPGTVAAQSIMAAVTRIVKISRPFEAGGFMIHRLAVTNARTIRDPSGDIHGVLNITAIAKEV